MIRLGKLTKERIIAGAIGLVTCLGIGVLILRTYTQVPQRYLMAPVQIQGAVMRDDSDPGKQLPLAGTEVTVSSGLNSRTGTADASGFFSVTLRPGAIPGQPIRLLFRHPQYLPLEMKVSPQDKLYVVRLEPSAQSIARLTQPASLAKLNAISDVIVRYSVQNQSTVDVGTTAKQFEVKNVGNVPCDGQAPCSPDGKWKAVRNDMLIDAGPGNEFRNVRVTCVGGPCAFTRIDTAGFAIQSRKKTITVLNWSDPASFVVEAEVIRPMVTDSVRHTYPFIVGSAMTFALPATAEGPSIEAHENGQAVVFPLGPNLSLSWATCIVEVAEQNKVYRCTLKPGYEFQP